MNRFLANVKCSLYDIASPSVVCLSVCLSSVLTRLQFLATFLRHLVYIGHRLTSTENFTEIVPGEPLRRGS